jgi:protein-L-isoaspartate(D-aspartate) O-methyltransferase
VRAGHTPPRLHRALFTGFAVAASCLDPTPAKEPVDSASYAAAREQMVARQLRTRDIDDERVLAAMAAVPRHAFVPPDVRDHAYNDQALPIGRGQTISQPYVVALMTQLLGLRGGERVLEIGTGSGYQAAVLSKLAGSVYSIEIDPELAATARDTLERLGYSSVHVRAGDGYFGWPEVAPFDAIIITAAAPRLPEALVGQLRDGGRVVAPRERRGGEELTVGHKQGDKLVWSEHGGVRFVPMTGEVRRTPAK